MDRKLLCSSLSALLFLLGSFSASAWTQSVSLGYGISRDPNHTEDTNSGVLLNGSLFTLAQSYWYHFTVDGSVGAWHTTSQYNKNLVTADGSLALRLYAPYICGLHPYLAGSFGPGILSSRHFGQNNQGSNFSFQTLLGLGVEKLDACDRGWDVKLHLTHYSNAYLFKPNEGYNIVYTLSIGYLF